MARKQNISENIINGEMAMAKLYQLAISEYERRNETRKY